jgi:hypothetical protein
MVHLAVAVQMHELNGTRPAAAFLLGSIAPDAIHMRPNAGPDEKGRTHLRDMPDSGEHQPIRDLLTGYWGQGSEAAGFAEGYAAHLLTDRMWIPAVLRPFGARFPQDVSDEVLRALYYREADWVDLDLYHRMPRRKEVWAQLAVAEPIDFQPLLTAAEIGQWRDRTIHWYEAQDRASMQEPVFITSSGVEAFISEAAQAIAGHFAAWSEGASRAVPMTWRPR